MVDYLIKFVARLAASGIVALLAYVTYLFNHNALHGSPLLSASIAVFIWAGIYHDASTEAKLHLTNQRRFDKVVL